MSETKENFPAWVIRFLRFLCPDSLQEEIEGDLIQKFHRDVESHGGRKARRMLFWNTVRYLRPGIIMRRRRRPAAFGSGIIANYLKISVRHIRYNPLFSFINIISLGIGFAAALGIFLFVHYEQSFDSFLPGSESIYRIYEQPNYDGSRGKLVALTMGWLGPAVSQAFPEITGYTRYWNRGPQVLRNGQDQFLEKGVVAVDSSFLNIFQFDLAQGNRSTALKDPHTVVVTETIARKYFGSSRAAFGNTLQIENEDFKITGILKDVPDNSHLQFDILVSIETYSRNDRMFSPTWDGSFLNTYLRIGPGADLKKLESELPAFMTEQTGIKDFDKSTTLRLQSLSQVHLNSSDIEHDDNNSGKFNGSYLRVFEIVALFILIIASINFMNLSIARSARRLKEIGLRKSFGVGRLQLLSQFIFETGFLTLLAILLAFAIDMTLLPLVNRYAGLTLTLTQFIMHPLWIGWIIGGALALGLLAGIYPAMYMSSFKPDTILKGGLMKQGKSVSGNFLVIMQFGLAIAMIECTMIVSGQLHYMANSNLGFRKDNLVLLGMNQEVNQKFDRLKTEWLRNSNVIGVTASSQRLGGDINAWGFKIRTDSGIYNFSPSNLNVDYDYLKVYGIHLRSGRDFSKEIFSDKGKAFIINETMAHDLGLMEPIGTPAGQAWYKNDSLGTIIGVVSDFNYNSLHFKINPIVMVCQPAWGYQEISIRVGRKNLSATIADINRVWDENISSLPFSYSFLDDQLDQQYRTDRQIGHVISMAAALSIVISAIGLFGLVTINVRRKIKEIGIRKVLGATKMQVTGMLTAGYAKTISIAFLMVSPFAYFIMADWLNNFAYRIAIRPSLFVISGLISLSVAFLTIIFQIGKAARANPVDALRCE